MRHVENGGGEDAASPLPSIDPREQPDAEADEQYVRKPEQQVRAKLRAAIEPLHHDGEQLEAEDEHEGPAEVGGGLATGDFDSEWNADQGEGKDRELEIEFLQQD